MFLFITRKSDINNQAMHWNVRGLSCVSKYFGIEEK